MEKIISRIFAIAVALAVVVSVLTACQKDCTSHADADKNGKCDSCGADVEAACDTHTDADKNGKCDSCGADVEVACDAHTDADKNGKCDTCGADVPADDSEDQGGNVTPPDVDLPLDPFI